MLQSWDSDTKRDINYRRKKKQFIPIGDVFTKIKKGSLILVQVSKQTWLDYDDNLIKSQVDIGQHNISGTFNNL